MAHVHSLPTRPETPSLGAQLPHAGELGVLVQHLAQLLTASRDGTNVLPIPHAYSEDQAAALLTQAGWETSARTLRKARDEGRISELTQRQRAFICSLGELGHSPGYINKTMTVLSACLGHAIDKGELMSRPKIILSKGKIAEIVQRPEKSELRPLSPKELARLLDAVRSPHLHRYLILALCTLARPDAICDLTWERVSPDIGTLNLNPPKRPQTKKFRPIIPIAPTLDAWFRVWAQDHTHLVHYHGKPVADPLLAIRRLAETAGLVTDADYVTVDGKRIIRQERSITPYTLHRSMSRLLRAKGASIEDIGGWLGHRIPKGNVTEVFYAPADPNYLISAKVALEKALDEIAAHTKVAPLRPTGDECSQIALKAGRGRAMFGKGREVGNA